MAAQTSRMAVGVWSVSLNRCLMNFFSVETRSSGSLKDECDLVHAGVSAKLCLPHVQPCDLGGCWLLRGGSR